MAIYSPQFDPNCALNIAIMLWLPPHGHLQGPKGRGGHLALLMWHLNIRHIIFFFNKLEWCILRLVDSIAVTAAVTRFHSCVWPQPNSDGPELYGFSLNMDLLVFLVLSWLEGCSREVGRLPFCWGVGCSREVNGSCSTDWVILLILLDPSITSRLRFRFPFSASHKESRSRQSSAWKSSLLSSFKFTRVWIFHGRNTEFFPDLLFFSPCRTIFTMVSIPASDAPESLKSIDHLKRNCNFCFWSSKWWSQNDINDCMKCSGIFIEQKSGQEDKSWWLASTTRCK